MAYVFGEILIWLLLAVAATAVVCWLLWRWRVQRVPYEEWAAMEIRAASPPADPAAKSDGEIEALRNELAGVTADRKALVTALAARSAELDEARAAVVAAEEAAAEAQPVEPPAPAPDAPAAAEANHDAAIEAARAEMESAARRVGELTALLEAERRRNRDGSSTESPDTDAELASLRAELEAARNGGDAELDAARIELAALRSQLAERDRDLELTRAEVAGPASQVNDAEVEALRAEALDLRSTVDEQAAELSELTERASRDASELLTAQQRLADLDRELADVRSIAARDLASRDAELAGADGRIVESEHRLTEALVEVERLTRELDSAAAARSPFDAAALAQREERLVADVDASAIRIKELEMALAASMRRVSELEQPPEQIIDVTEPPPPSALDLARAWSSEAPDRSMWDDLTRINGVGPKLASLLQENGIYTFDQVASLTDAEVDELQEQLPEFPGRIRRDAWVEQAERLLA